MFHAPLCAVNWAGRWLAGLLWLLVVCSAAAQPALRVGGAPLSNPLGPQARYLVESGPALDIAAAQHALAQGAFAPDPRPVASYGIGAAPVWAWLEVVNPGNQPLTYELTAGMTWIDRVDVYLVQQGRVLSAWSGGDTVAGAAGVVPALGLTTRLVLPPGRSEVFVRAAAADPLVLPLALETPDEARQQQRGLLHGYGMLYGFLLACVVFTAILFAALRTRTSLYYGLYLLSFLFMNMNYTGHALVWWWPDWPGLQRFVVLVSMVLFACAGLLFATRFLEFAVHAPVVQRWVDRICLAVLGLMAVFVVTTQQVAAALLAFGFVVCFTVGMVALGVFALRVSRAAGRYFLFAAVCGALGAASSSLSTWGLLPMNALTFRGVEIGVVLEATLLGIALALRARELEQARRDAEHQARTDPLTGLPNRRDFLERAEHAWAVALRRSRPLSVLMLDIDHFKAINDRHGHEAGDVALVAVARVLADECRAGDIPARWGGEEFVLLLSDTVAPQAVALAERLRVAIAAESVRWKGQALAVTASIGVVQREAQDSVAALLAEADQWLYAAKRSGRNRVASPPDQARSA